MKLPDSLLALANSPAALKAQEDAHKRDVAERTERLARLAALDAEALKQWPLNVAAVEKAIEARNAAHAALKASEAVLAKANAVRSESNCAYERSVAVEREALAGGADKDAIDAWKRECLSEVERLGRPGIIITNTVSERSEVTSKQVGKGYSNIKSINVRMNAVRQSYHAADDLLLVADQRTVPQLIAAQRASWAAVDQNPGVK